MQVLVMLVDTAVALCGGSRSRPGESASRCSAARLTVKLDAGQSFAQEVGDLELRISATHGKTSCNGWAFSLEDANGNDFIYPVNMPLRFNPSQFLGCSCGLRARQGLKMKRNLRFILSEQDYLRLAPLMRDALWPGDSLDPEHAAEKYLKAIRTLRTGLIRLDTVHSALTPDGHISSATFRVELIAPDSINFGPGLKPHSTPCPANPDQ